MGDIIQKLHEKVNGKFRMPVSLREREEGAFGRRGHIYQLGEYVKVLILSLIFRSEIFHYIHFK